MRPSLSIDLNSLNDTLDKKSFKLSPKELASKQVEKIAWDIVRFPSDDDRSRLWQVQSADDGDYIVSLYEEPTEVEKTASAKNLGWETVMNGNKVNVFYKGAHLASLTATQLGIPTEDLLLVERYLPAKLATNKSLATALINDLPNPAQVYNKYPELA